MQALQTQARTPNRRKIAVEDLLIVRGLALEHRPNRAVADDHRARDTACPRRPFADATSAGADGDGGTADSAGGGSVGGEDEELIGGRGGEAGREQVFGEERDGVAAVAVRKCVGVERDVGRQGAGLAVEVRGVAANVAGAADAAGDTDRLARAVAAALGDLDRLRCAEH
jgi:hypothetical protein